MDWDTFDSETRRLAELIDFVPDIIVGIARGGVIPATLLSKILKVKNMFTLTLDREGERKISAFLTQDIQGKKILLVEDMIETGRGLSAGKKFLEEKGEIIKTACLYTMPLSEMTPDYSLNEVPEVVPFPWNKE